jgi:hypothetical protein
MVVGTRNESVSAQQKATKPNKKQDQAQAVIPAPHKPPPITTYLIYYFLPSLTEQLNPQHFLSIKRDQKPWRHPRKKKTASRKRTRKKGRILLNPAGPCQLVSVSTVEYFNFIINLLMPFNY